jgi:DNA-binding XRE family transcriptional regulator
MIRYYAIVVRQHLGIGGLIGVGVLLMSAVYFELAIQTAKTEIQLQQATLAGLQSELDQHPPVKARSYAEQIQAFRAGFPLASTTEATIGQLIEAGQKAGVAFENGKYEPQSKCAVDLACYQVNMPIKASYLQIKRLLAEVTNTLPNAQLASISLRRNSPEEPLLDASLSIVLYFRPD